MQPFLFSNTTQEPAAVYELRDYQASAIDAACNFIKYRDGHGYITAPGGSGKSVMIAKLAEWLYERGHRIVMLARSEKLLRQNRDKLVPRYREQAGIYCAGLGEKDMSKPITIASVQSIAGVAHPQGFDFALVDECDEIHPDSEGDTQYWKFFRNNGNPRIVGFTATPYRAASGPISWGEEIINIPIAPLIERGYLVPPINKVGIEVDLSKVEVTSLGDYNQPQLDAVYDDPTLLRISVEKLLKYGATREHPLVFTQSLRHSDAVASALEYAGESVMTVNGSTDKDELTDEIIPAFERGDFKWLINCQLMTVGYDIPCVDMIALLMATKSKRKFEQATYRGTRLNGMAKKNFLLLDMGNNLMEHGGLGSPYRGKQSKGERAPPRGKICPECETFVHPPMARECLDCGFQFPEPESPKVDHARRPDDTSSPYYTGSSEADIMEHAVDYVSYKSRKSKSGNPMIVVEYQCNYGKYGTIAEFLLPFHTSSMIRGKVARFFKDGGYPLEPWPNEYTMEDFIMRAEAYVKCPTQIVVNHRGEFPQIIRKIYGDPAAVKSINEVLDGDEIPW